MDELDNLIREDNLDGPWEDSANFHVPITLWMMKQMHARVYAALLGDGYGFVTLPQEKMDLEKVREVDQIMRWAITSYANNWRGIALTIDDWIFDVVKYGWGVLRVMWDSKYQKVSLTEEELRRFNKTASIESTLDNMIQIIKTWEGPQIDTVAHENILFPGRAKDSMNMDEFPMVAEIIELTPEDVRRRITQKRWFKGPAEEVLKMYEGTTTNNTTTNRQLDDVKRIKDAAQGIRDLQSDASVNKKISFYQIKARVDVDNDSFEEDLVYIWEPVTKKVMTVTTLDRVNVTMSSFYHKVDFIRRPRRTRGIGMAELLYSINREIDAMHNQRIDFGTISSVPTFFFRPLSGMKAEKIQLKPGQGIPLANPRTDVFIPNFSSNITFTRQEENLLINYAERVAALPATLFMPNGNNVIQ